VKKLNLAVAVVVSLFATSIQPSSATENYAGLFTPVARGDASTESIYFVMTDRFANGDTSNDRGGLTGGLSQDGFDPTDIGYWHGGDFKGLTAHLDYIKKMGFTAIWITPPIKQQTVQGDSGAYHGYWGLDFLAVDPHLGTAADFKEFVDKSHALGMKVILDVVANHTADVIQYLDGKPYIPAGKETIKNPAFLNDIANYHNQGPSTFSGESLLTGDFYGLDDLATEKPAVVKGFIDIWSYWINTFGIDGLRIDTFRHVNPEFWKQVIPAIQQVAKNAGKKSFPIFGEVAVGAPDILSTYVVSGQTPSVLDFGFNDQITRFIAQLGEAERLAAFFNQDDLYTSPTTSAYGLATFLGNHDMGRIGRAILSTAYTDQEALNRDLLAQASLALLRGGPITYYGDEVGMTGEGGDKRARQDMFSTQVETWKSEVRIGSAPIGEGNSFVQTNPIRDEITTLNGLTAKNPALRNGTQQTIYAKDQTFAVTRFADGIEYVVLLNAADASKLVNLSPLNRSASWKTLAGSCVAKGSLTTEIKANSYCLFKADKVIGKSPTKKISAPKVGFTNDSPLWPQISVTVDKAGYNSIAFYAREKGKKWVALGTTDRSTFATKFTAGGLYRVFLHPETFKKNAALEIIAVGKNSDGKILVSPITKARNS
jgi:glycosidase